MSQASLNRTMLIGNMGAKPELRATPSGLRVATVSIATTEVWRDKDSGKKKERTEWHRVVFFNRLADIVEQYTGKGTYVYVEGSLQTRKWADKDGIERYTTEIKARELKILSGKAKDIGAIDTEIIEEQ